MSCALKEGFVFSKKNKKVSSIIKAMQKCEETSQLHLSIFK